MSLPSMDGPVPASSGMSPLFGDLVEDIVRGVLREHRLPSDLAAGVAGEVRARITRLQRATTIYEADVERWVKDRIRESHGC